MRPITVTLIACDEEDRITEAIASVTWADEILVLDSGSRDDTVARARTAGATVVETDWPGYGVQKNRAARRARNRWLLSLDADERVNKSLRSAILSLPDEPTERAFHVRRRNRIAGKALRHWPWAWDRTTRLYDRNHASFTEAPVHESLRVDGPIGDLGGILEHETYRSWADCAHRQRRYARLGAEAALVGGRVSRPGDTTLRPLLALLRHLLVRGHLLGGSTGVRYSWCAARGTFLKYSLLRQLSAGRSTPKGSSSDVG